MVRTILLAVAVLLVSDAAFARNHFRPKAEEEACRADAKKLCSDAIPDQFKVLTCLQSHRTRLSHGCRTVLESNGQ